MATLLGHLAQFGSFFSQGEDLCPQGLAYLLKEHAGARSTFADEIAARVGIPVASAIGAYVRPGTPVQVNFDITRDGNINVVHLQQSAANIGVC